jgi:hypothetical protein
MPDQTSEANSPRKSATAAPSFSQMPEKILAGGVRIP